MIDTCIMYDNLIFVIADNLTHSQSVVFWQKFQL